MFLCAHISQSHTESSLNDPDQERLDYYDSFDPEDPSGHFTATVRSPKGRRVTVIGTLGDPEPEITGDAMLTDNAAIAQNLWSAVSEYAQAIALEEDDERTYGDLSDMEVRDRDDDRSRAESIRQKQNRRNVPGRNGRRSGNPTSTRPRS